MQTSSAAQCLKLITRQGCERIVRLAFEFARSEGRKSSMRQQSEHHENDRRHVEKNFEEIATEYPEIESGHVIVDNCAHQLVKSQSSLMFW